VISDEKVWLLDSLGELMAAFDLSDIVTMGGSFSGVGGHNPLEPALFNKPIIVGHNMSNFNEIMQHLRQEHAIIELSKNEPSKQLCHEINILLQHPTRQQALGKKALKVVLANQGASDKTLLQVKKLLPTIPIDTHPIDANTTPNSVGDNS
jgi:3-deoxy-D-manno-octulosonic-acid transferase